MKLLFDQNLSPALVKVLADLFPDSVHVSSLGMGEADDREIAQYAKENDFTVVTKDVGFPKRAYVRRPPPKIISIRTGNCGTNRVHELIRQHFVLVRDFYSEPNEPLLILK